MRRLVPALAAVTIVALALCGCSSGTPEPKRPSNPRMSSSVQKVNGISVTLRAQPAVAKQGGTFDLTLTVRNLSGKPVTYTLPTGQTYEFIASTKGGGDVWRWSQGKFFTEAVNTIALAPGASKDFKVAWDLGTTAAGLYTIQGFFLGLPGVRPTVSVEVTAASS